MSTVLEDLCGIFGRDISNSREDLSSISATTYELQVVFEEKFPYTTRRLLTGDKYIFSKAFMDKIRYAMSTDYLGFLDTFELNTWEALVQFEEELSHSPDTELYPTAIGCTIPDEFGVSYVVTDAGITANTCSIITSEFIQIQLASDLDEALMKILNCEEYIPVAISQEELINVSPTCTI